MAQVQTSSQPFLATTPVIAAATPAAATTFFVAPVACTVTSVNYIYSVISTSGTIQLKKDTGVAAPGSGNSILTGGTATNVGSGGVVANTYSNNALTATAADLVLAAGDRLSFTPAGTLTSLAGCVFIVTLQ